jgi:hypothetical protein
MTRSLKIIFFIFLLNTFSHAQETFPINGVQESFKPVYAFINANIIISSEKEIKNGTLLIQDNLIIGVDSNLSIPENAITYDLKGDYIYPSFIDLYSSYGLKKPSKKSAGLALNMKVKKMDHIVGMKQFIQRYMLHMNFHMIIKTEKNIMKWVLDLLLHTSKMVSLGVQDA